MLTNLPFVRDEGEPGRHEGGLEQVGLVHHHPADPRLRVQGEGQRIKARKVELERLRVRQQGLQLLDLLLAIDILSGHRLHQGHQPVDELVLALQELAPLLPVRRATPQRLQEALQHRPIHVLDLEVRLVAATLHLLALDEQVPVEVVGQAGVAAGSLDQKRGEILAELWRLPG